MRKPDVNPQNVQMTDVLCDFCHREWSAEEPMIEGHQGSCICGKCVAAAYAELSHHSTVPPPHDYTCPMCLEGDEDRATLNRETRPAWQSPLDPKAVICLRCVKLAATALEKDKEFDWKKPS